MADTFFSQIKSRGEEFLTEVSNNLMSNPTFVELLKKGIAAKEEIDKRVAAGLKSMNVVTRREVSKLEERIARLENELQRPRAKPRRPRRKAR